MSTVILHDFFASPEGGGKLCLTLAQALDAGLGYGFRVRPHPFFDNFALSGQQHDLGCRSDIPGWRQFRLMRAFARDAGFVAGYDTAVYSGFYAPLAVHGHAGRNVYYCHTPPRFVYDQRDFYLASVPAWQRPALRWLAAYLQPRYEAAVARMDVVVANSEHVRARIRRFLGVDAVVVHPPCDTASYTWADPDPNLDQTQPYYLSVARLDPLKRVDRIVEAFRAMPDRRLMVASSGPDEARIRALAADAPNIEVLGWVDEARYRALVGGCMAAIYIPADEDFGMSPVEAMAAGKPVIGVAEGGLVETVVHGETGVLLDPDPSPDLLRDAVRDMTSESALAMRPACEARAREFAVERFLDGMRAVLG